MTAADARTRWTLWLALGRSAWHGDGRCRALLISRAAIALPGLLVLAAAHAGRTAHAAAAAERGTDRGATPISARPRIDFGAYLGAPYHYPSDFHLKKAGRHDLTIKNVEWYTQPVRQSALLRRAHSALDAKADASARWSTSRTPKPTRRWKRTRSFEGTLDGKPVPETAKIGDFFDKLEFSHGHNMLTLTAWLAFGGFSTRSALCGLGSRQFHCRIQKCIYRPTPRALMNINTRGQRRRRCSVLSSDAHGIGVPRIQIHHRRLSRARLPSRRHFACRSVEPISALVVGRGTAGRVGRDTATRAIRWWAGFWCVFVPETDGRCALRLSALWS